MKGDDVIHKHNVQGTFRLASYKNMFPNELVRHEHAFHTGVLHGHKNNPYPVF